MKDNIAYIIELAERSECIDFKKVRIVDICYTESYMKKILKRVEDAMDRSKYFVVVNKINNMNKVNMDKLIDLVDNDTIVTMKWILESIIYCGHGETIYNTALGWMYE